MVLNLDGGDKYCHIGSCGKELTEKEAKDNIITVDTYIGTPIKFHLCDKCINNVIEQITCPRPYSVGYKSLPSVIKGAK